MVCTVCMYLEGNRQQIHKTPHQPVPVNRGQKRYSTCTTPTVHPSHRPSVRISKVLPLYPCRYLSAALYYSKQSMIAPIDSLRTTRQARHALHLIVVYVSLPSLSTLYSLLYSHPCRRRRSPATPSPTTTSTISVHAFDVPRNPEPRT